MIRCGLLLFLMPLALSAKNLGTFAYGDFELEDQNYNATSEWQEDTKFYDSNHLLRSLSANNYDTSQPIINDIVDLILKKIISHLEKNHDDKIKIPDLEEKFSVGTGIIKTNGRFTATNGYFSGITTVRRTTDVILNRNGKKLSASCGFGISEPFIKYKKYKLKFGIVNVDGEISATIAGLSADFMASVDYNLHPCKINVEDFRIVDYGKIKINVTGLSPLNKLASLLTTWISKKWESEIMGMVESKIKDRANSELMKINCEKYRSFFEKYQNEILPIFSNN